MRKHTRRRRLSMTSLIDVIFLLLLFFMLTSTFSKFSEVELAKAGGAGALSAQSKPVFLQITPDDLLVNARSTPLDALPLRLQADLPLGSPLTVIISLQGEVTAQRLTDALIVLNGVDGVTPIILGAT